MFKEVIPYRMLIAPLPGPDPAEQLGWYLLGHAVDYHDLWFPGDVVWVKLRLNNDEPRPILREGPVIQVAPDGSLVDRDEYDRLVSPIMAVGEGRIAFLYAEYTCPVITAAMDALAGEQGGQRRHQFDQDINELIRRPFE
jgi:hypothetical protein